MSEKITLLIERDDKLFIGSCPEVPGARAQGGTLMACCRNLVQAISLHAEEKAPITRLVEVDVLGRRNSYHVELIESFEGFSVSCPNLSGCFSQGDDEEEAIENIQNAIRDYLEVAEETRTHSGISARVA